MQENIRSFIAIELPENTRLDLYNIIQQLKSQVLPGQIRWVSPENIHLTLQFLGDCSPIKLSEIRKMLVSHMICVKPFIISVNNLGAFPNLKNPQVIWAGIQPNSNLKILFQRIHEDLIDLKIPVEEKPFSPHLTLGRLGRHQSRLLPLTFFQTLNDIKIETQFNAVGVTLFKSSLSRSGAIYTPHAKFSFSV